MICISLVWISIIFIIAETWTPHCLETVPPFPQIVVQQQLLLSDIDDVFPFWHCVYTHTLSHIWMLQFRRANCQNMSFHRGLYTCRWWWAAPGTNLPLLSNCSYDLYSYIKMLAMWCYMLLYFYYLFFPQKKKTIGLKERVITFAHVCFTSFSTDEHWLQAKVPASFHKHLSSTLIIFLLAHSQTHSALTLPNIMVLIECLPVTTITLLDTKPQTTSAYKYYLSSVCFIQEKDATHICVYTD